MEKVAKHPRDFPNIDEYGHRKAVCCRCHCVMMDIEPMSPHGEYWHPTLNKKGKPHSCVNAGKSFTDRNTEVEPFLRKGRRRALKRMGIRA